MGDASTGSPYGILDMSKKEYYVVWKAFSQKN